MSNYVKLLVVLVVLCVLVTLCIIFRKPILKTLTKYYNMFMRSKPVKVANGMKNEVVQNVKDKISGQKSFDFNKKGE